MSVRFTPDATRDIDTIADDLDDGWLGDGRRFRLDLRDVLGTLERLPLSRAEYEPPSPLFPGLRVTQLRRFRYHLVFYQPTADGILVVRCLHGSRNIAAIFGYAGG